MEGELGTIASHLLSAFGVYMLMLIRLWGCKAPHPCGGNPGSGGILVQPFASCLSLPFAPLLLEKGRGPHCAQFLSSWGTLLPPALVPMEPRLQLWP